MRKIPAFVLVAALFAPSLQARAQEPAQTQMVSGGARAGSSVIPSTHSPGCAGLLCDSDDPRRVANVAPPPCQGLLCSLSPYSMAPPVTSATVAQQQERARAEAAAAAAPAPAPEKSRKRRAKARSAKPGAVATRTPEPAAAQ